jgi:hypothetical protein
VVLMSGLNFGGTETMTHPRRRRNPFATVALVLIATAAVFAAVGLVYATYPPRLASIVLSWQGALALGLTFAWGLADLVLLRRGQRPPFTNRVAAKRALTVRAFSGAVMLIIVGVDLGLLVMAGLAIKTALLIGGTLLVVWIGLVIAVLMVALRRRRRPAGRV